MDSSSQDGSRVNGVVSWLLFSYRLSSGLGVEFHWLGLLSCRWRCPQRVKRDRYSYASPIAAVTFYLSCGGVLDSTVLLFLCGFTFFSPTRVISKGLWSLWFITSLCVSIVSTLHCHHYSGPPFGPGRTLCKLSGD